MQCAAGLNEWSSLFRLAWAMVWIHGDDNWTCVLLYKLETQSLNSTQNASKRAAALFCFAQIGLLLNAALAKKLNKRRRKQQCQKPQRYQSDCDVSYPVRLNGSTNREKRSVHFNGHWYSQTGASALRCSPCIANIVYKTLRRIRRIFSRPRCSYADNPEFGYAASRAG